MENPDVEKSEETNRQIDSNTKSNSKQQSVEKANEHPDWLPDGWNVEVRTRKSGVHMGSGYKCYIEPLKGYKFFSKPEVLRYLETVKDNSCTSKKGKKCSNMHSPKHNSCTSKKEKKCSNMHSPNDNNCTSKKEKKCTNMDSPDDNSCTLKKEKNCSNMDSPNDKSCTSKKEKNCSNLDSPNDNSCTLKEKNCGNMDSPNNNSFTPEKEKNCCNMDSPIDNSCSSKKKNCSNMDSPTDVVVEKSTVEDLPPGWVKELKIRKNSKGIRKDPFYIDPASGYVFRSKKDVLRYLESGDIRSCAFKPSRRQVQDEDNLTPPPAAKRQKLKQSAPEQQLSSATEILDKSNLELLDANSSRKGKNANVSSGMMVASVPMGESVEKMHSLEDGAANSSELKKTSDPSSSALLNESLKESEQVLSADDVQEKEHVVNMMENAIEKNHSNYSISKNRKEFNVPHRSSPRLAGSKPVQLANNVMNEQTLQVPKRNLRKSRNTLDIDISEDQTVSKEQPHQQEADKIEDKKPEIQISSNKSSKKKEYHLPRRASKRLAAIEHETMNSKAKLQQSECGPVTVLADQAPTNGKSANKRKKSEPQLGKRENEEMEDEKSESQLSFAFHYSWSDPSLEYAINTLTGVLPPAETDIPKTLVDNVTGKGATTIPETDIPKSLVDNATGKGTTTVPETDIQKTLVDNVTGRSGGSENNLLDTVAGSRDRKSQARSNKPKKKKEVKVPMRLSKRLAGLEPEVLPAERALEYSTRKSCKEEPTATATLTNGVSDHHDAGEETKLTPQASDSLKTEVLGESLNQSEKSYDAQTGHKEQLQKVEAENIGDARSEPQLPLPFGNSWSDPCLEFAIKTLTGALPVDAGDIMPALPPGFDNPPYKQLHGNVVTSINQEAHDNSNQSQNKKELNMVSQLVLRSSSTSYENAPKFTTRQSYLDQGNIIGNLNEEPRHTGNITPPVHHSRNINSLTHEEPLKQNGQVVEGGFVTTEQQLFETGTVNHDNSELQYCAPFMNSWSDPCLEFAFKTLTGVIPVEENLTLQGCFQEPVNYHERRDGGSMLPDLGSSCFSQSDFSFLHDTGVKSMPGQQPSISSSFLPLEKTSLQGFAGVDPQTQFSQCNNNFQRR
ncbi:Methyl-CpG-binding domain-containing protein 13 [Glycine soja]|nr:Methyl-CpG-binding domain-containing protein 13 [Glycine soja]